MGDPDLGTRGKSEEEQLDDDGNAYVFLQINASSPPVTIWLVRLSVITVMSVTSFIVAAVIYPVAITVSVASVSVMTVAPVVFPIDPAIVLPSSTLFSSKQRFCLV